MHATSSSPHAHLPTPAIPSATSAPTSGGFTFGGIASLVLAAGFTAAASATTRSEMGNAGWITGIGAAMLLIAVLMLPAREPKVATSLGAIGVLVGIIGMSSEWELGYLMSGTLAYAASRVFARHALTLTRIAGGIAALIVGSAWAATGRDATDAISAAAALLAATAAIDAIGWFLRPRAFVRQPATPAT